MRAKSFPTVYLALSICLIYWAYLGFVTHFVIIWDAEGYIAIAKSLLTQGWQDYFNQGPQREPVYPWLISLSLHLSQTIHIPFDDAQRILQLTLLLLCQVGVIQTLRLAAVRESIIALTVLYIGFSPAILSVTLTLFSESATLPLIVAIIFITTKYFSETIFKLYPNQSKNIIAGALLGVCLTVLTLTKGVCEPVSIIFLLSLLSLIISIRKKYNQKIIRHCFAFILIATFSFFALTTTFKLKNFFSNGVYTVTNRGPSHFYGPVITKTTPVPLNQWPVILATVPSMEFCYSIYEYSTCDAWSVAKSIIIGDHRATELMEAGKSQNTIYRTLFLEGITHILNNLPQYFFFIMLDSTRFLFWESMHVGFTAFPTWLTHIYSIMPLEFFLLIFSFVLTSAAIVFSITQLTNKKNMPSKSLTINNVMLYTILSFSLPYIGFSSLGITLNRMAVCVAPLHLILIAIMFEIILKTLKRNRIKTYTEKP